MPLNKVTITGADDATSIKEMKLDWIVTLCGHPTALYPYLIYLNGEQMVLAPNGMAWQLKKDAESAARLIAMGKLATYVDHRGYRCAGDGPRQEQIIAALTLIGSRLTGPPASADSGSTNHPRRVCELTTNHQKGN